MSEHNKTQQDFNGDFNTLLIRIDERTRVLCENMEEIKKDLKENYVLQADFKPIKNIVMGAVKIILVTVLTAVLYLVIKH